MKFARLRIVRPGLHDTIPGLASGGWRSFGVPTSGPFDPDAHGLANALVGNAAGAATVEMTWVGGEFEALHVLGLALAGAPMAARIERWGGAGVRMEIPQSFTLFPGDRLVMGGTARGARTYLAARGGWGYVDGQGPEDRLQTRCVLLADAGGIPARRPAPGLLAQPAEGPIRVIDGPDAPAEPSDWEALAFRLGPQSDRMGLRLEGPPLDLPADPDRVSAPVAPGAVQVAGGQLLILGPACGTMGGYPNVAHVSSADLGRLAQLRPGDELRLRRIGLDEARRLDRDDRRRRAARHATLRVAAGDDSCGRLIGGH